MKRVLLLQIPARDKTAYRIDDYAGSVVWGRHEDYAGQLHDEVRSVHRLKAMIDRPQYNVPWDVYKRLTNPYEFVHMTSNRHRKSENMAMVNPISRSFFKLWEMLTDFSLLRERTPVQTAHLAEGPGGFIDAIRYYRRNHVL